VVAKINNLRKRNTREMDRVYFHAWG
jgi:hypothetical protein